MAGDSPTSKRPPMAAGQRYGRLVALAFVETVPRRGERWRFRCDCGGETVALAYHAQTGNTRSCGCLQRERVALVGRANTTHKMSYSGEYSCWRAMLKRCGNPKHKHYSDYGGRGIKVCERWQTFQNFYADMGPRPSPKHSLERKDHDGNYEPGNVKWATRQEQQRNKRNNIMVMYQGREILLVEACEEAKIDHVLVRQRLRDGWSIERALARPSGRSAPP